MLVGRWVLYVLLPPLRSRVRQTSRLGRSDRMSLQWEVSLYTCEALSERAKAGGQSCVTFHATFVALDFRGFRTRQICMEHSEKRRNKFPLVNVRRGAIPIQRASKHKTLHQSMPFLSQNLSLRMSTCSQETMEAMGSFEVLKDMGCDYGLRDDAI